MSKIRCPKCGSTSCDHDARHLAEADEADRLGKIIWLRNHPGHELPPCSETNQLARDEADQKGLCANCPEKENCPLQ